MKSLYLSTLFFPTNSDFIDYKTDFNLFEFSPTWICVSLPRPTTSKLLKITHMCLISAQIFAMLRHKFYSQQQWFGRLIKQIKNDNSRDQQDKG